jgi:hypothetical protein
VAGSLAQMTKPNTLSPREERWQELVAEALISGKTPGQIARRLAKGDTQKYWNVYGRIRRLVRRDALFQARMLEMAKGEAYLHLGPSVAGLGRKAAWGRPDAVKLLWEMTGLHNPRIQHEHSGGIDIRLSIPRPETTQDQLGPGKDPESSEYVDADVVEEDET